MMIFGTPKCCSCIVNTNKIDEIQILVEAHLKKAIELFTTSDFNNLSKRIELYGGQFILEDSAERIALFRINFPN